MSLTHDAVPLPGVPVFFPVRLADALSSSPEDPNSIFNAGAFSEDAAGWDVEIQGPLVDGMPEACWFRYVLGAGGVAPFDAWRGDGTQWLLWRFTEVSVGDDNWWCQCGIMDGDAIPAGSPQVCGGGFEYPTPIQLRNLVSNLTVGVGIALGAPPLLAGFALTMPAGPDDGTGTTGHAIAWGKAGTPLYFSNELGVQATNVGTKRAVVGFGTRRDTSGGAVSGKMGVEAAVIEWLGAGLLP